MDFGVNPYDIAFFALAPLVALALLRVRRRLYVAIAVAVTAVAGWGLESAASSWLDSAWISLMEQTPNPSPRLLEQFNGDGASKTAALLFGLPVSLAYATICFVVARGARRTACGIRSCSLRPIQSLTTLKEPS
jgi:hypothetical protein